MLASYVSDPNRNHSLDAQGLDFINHIMLERGMPNVDDKVYACDCAYTIKELAKYRQILMITHQAIIASRSDRHFYVAKSQEDSTKVSVKVLSAEEKINAVAELAGGVLSDVSIEFAKTLIH